MKCNSYAYREQLQSFQTTVRSTVQDTMKSEMKSYSSVLRETSTPAIIPPETLKEVAQAVLKEEDRGKNIMLFGLKEERDEDLL